jgi:origin recognition complex subunit 5
VTTPRALYLQKAGIPYLRFPPYTRAEAISLVTRSTPSLALQQHLEKHQDLSTLQRWYSLFVTTVYDSAVSPTSLSLSHFQQTCETLWPRFIWPYISGEPPPGKSKNAQWDFAKLLVRQRSLFQMVGEESLTARLLPKVQAITFDELQQEQDRIVVDAEKDIQSNKSTSSTIPKTSLSHRPLPSQPSSQRLNPPLLSFFSTLVLTAAYLASHTPPKLDILLFSRLSSSSRSARIKKSYHRRKLFQSPSKPRAGAVSNADEGGGGGGGSSTTTSKKKATGKSGLELNLNLPRSFTLERLAAILRAIHPSGVSRGRTVVDRVGREVAELERLRLLVPADGVGGGGLGGYGTRALGDDGGEERRWRVNVPRGFVEDLGGRYAREGLGGMIREFELLEG